MSKSSFSSPVNSKDWQNAYTEKQAFTDSSQWVGSFLVSIAFLLMIPFFIAIFSVAIQLLNAQAEGLSKANLIAMTIAGVFTLVAPFIFLGVILKRLFISAETFLRSFYNLAESEDVKNIVNMRFFGRPLLPPPLSAIFKFMTVEVKNGKLDSHKNWVTQIGGPVRLKIEPGNAVYLERGNHFSRVLGSDAAFLELHETVRTVLNVGPQNEEITAKAWTRDGIRITIQAKGEYFLGSPELKVGEENDWFSHNPDSVRLAVEHALKNGREGHEWIKSAVGKTTGVLTNFIMNKHLEELFIASADGGQLLSNSTMNHLLEEINENLQKDGIHLSCLQITNVDLPEQIKEQRIKIWEFRRKNQEILALSEVTAHELHTRKQALAEMLRDMVFTLANGLVRTEENNSTEELLSSIYSVLNQGMKERGNRSSSQSKKTTSDGIASPNLDMEIPDEDS